jgi:hypothetical protein
MHDLAYSSLNAPVILIWDNLNTHISAAMGVFISGHPGWLTEVRLPSYAPELNPAEGVWANMKNGLGNLAARNVDQLAAVVKNRLKRIQYRPQLIDGFLAQTGLILEPQPPCLQPPSPPPTWTSSPRSSRVGSRASSAGPPSSTDSSPRPDSPSTPNRRRPRPFNLCSGRRRGQAVPWSSRSGP